MRYGESEPQPNGFLDPPKRFPPTAIGVATPPPPGRRRWTREGSGLRRRMRKLTALLLVFSAGLAIGSVLPVVASASVMLGLSALLAVVRYRRRRWRAWRRERPRANAA